MTSLADRTIAALRANHDHLTHVTLSLSDAQLEGPSGAGEWSVAQVLSHLGSGAEIGLATYRASLDGADAPDDDFNRSVWARWDSSTPREQADGFVESNSALVEFLESLTPEQREGAQIKLGFMPFPLPVAAVAGMRLNEAANHAWDVDVALDPAAPVDAEAAAILLEQFTEHLGFLLGFTAKADALPQTARVRLGASDTGIVIADSVSLTTSVGDATATLHGPAESIIRLISGRLGADHTPAEVRVEGNVSLADLRRVFPGY